MGVGGKRPRGEAGRTKGPSDDRATGQQRRVALVCQTCTFSGRAPDLLTHTLKGEDPWFRQRRRRQRCVRF